MEVLTPGQDVKNLMTGHGVVNTSMANHQDVHTSMTGHGGVNTLMTIH
jgi:hypothetical protein